MSRVLFGLRLLWGGKYLKILIQLLIAYFPLAMVFSYTFCVFQLDVDGWNEQRRIWISMRMKMNVSPWKLIDYIINDIIFSITITTAVVAATIIGNNNTNIISDKFNVIYRFTIVERPPKPTSVCALSAPHTLSRIYFMCVTPPASSINIGE